LAQYDVYQNRNGAGYLIDVQSDLLDQLQTRVVIPLLPADDYPKPMQRLNPIVTINGVDHVLAAHFLAAITVSELGDLIQNLSNQHDAIRTSLDMVFIGF
jgi:toxin CcdB